MPPESRESLLAAAVARIAAAPRPPVPWRDGQQIPWNDPAFSERILRVHLDQTTHMASRSREVIVSHVRWLRQMMREEFGDDPARRRVLDVGCGPGLYCHELARHGYRTVGFDFSPAALAHAEREAAAEKLDCRFFDLDLNRLGEASPAGQAAAAPLAAAGPFDAVTFWFGELHSFPEATVRRFLPRLAALLAPGGLFVLEYQPYALYLREDLQEWRACDSSAFSDRPHLWLQEYHWDEGQQAEINVHWIIDAATGELSRYAQCSRAYRDRELVALFADAGLVRPAFYPPITGVSERFEFAMMVTRKGG